MKQFAKLFEGTPHGQILVKLGQSTEKDGPEVRFSFYAPRLGESSIALVCDDTEAGWMMAEKAFEKVDEQLAISLIGSDENDFLRNLKASIGLDPDSTALEADADDRNDYFELQQQHDELKTLYFNRGEHIQSLEKELLQASTQLNAASAEAAVEWSGVALLKLLEEIKNQVGVTVPMCIVNDALDKLGLREHFGNEAIDQAKLDIKQRSLARGTEETHMSQSEELK